MEYKEGSSISCRLLHHGAAATSSSKCVLCIPPRSASTTPSSTTSTEEDIIIYASHAILNVAHQISAKVGDRDEPIWTVRETLRTASHGSANANATVSTYTAKRIISSISQLKNSRDQDTTTIVSGFTDGTISSWRRTIDQGWQETVLVKPDDEKFWDGRSITDIAGIFEGKKNEQYCIVSCSSGGAYEYRMTVGSSGDVECMSRNKLLTTSANTVRFHNLAYEHDTTILLIGTAAPRHNKIHVFSIGQDAVSKPPLTNYCGALAGHEDWITCFDWRSTMSSIDYLASGSQDARIRLWKFTTSTSVASPTLIDDVSKVELEDQINDDSDDDDDDDDEEEIEEGESRLEIVLPDKAVTSVTLEALLIGHEERVTDVTWHPNPKTTYGEDLILISSSMDRSIFIWSEVSGIWAPVSRVGSAGGILGGSIGSSLLGFLNVQVDPTKGKWMVAHGYGGALHHFSCEPVSDLSDNLSVEERAALSPWKAKPCLTGHFEGVTDLCWEATSGDYLITVGNDQTCRTWAPLRVNTKDKLSKGEVWVEIGRPQVHGYDLSAITSISTMDHRHLIVSGADEKELRVFDGTKAFNHLLQRVYKGRDRAVEEDSILERVDLAYIPSLGLSNKASAAEGAEQDTGGVSESSTQLPLERDLGAMSLWPETLKLYGHNSELVRLTSTAVAKSGLKEDLTQEDVIVASSAKARDMDDACIRLWNVENNRCLQVLKGGHRSTVTALCFSSDLQHLVSSGKDRRLCLWTRDENGQYQLSCTKDGAHKRIVWGAHFCPFDPSILSTCSRDGTIKLWSAEETATKGVISELAMFSPKSLGSNGKPDAVTSISFAPKEIVVAGKACAVLAIGLESGLIEIWKTPINVKELQPTLIFAMPTNQCHISSVTKLAWRPIKDLDEGLNLASCSTDHGCRIWELRLN